MLRRTSLTTLSFFAFYLLACTTSGLAADPDPTKLEFFEKHVRPLLSAHCVECHGPKEPKSGLRLDSRAGLYTGGDSGAAVVPGKPSESLLLEAVRYESFEMPPKGQLPDADIAVIERWIAEGAVWPEYAEPIRPNATRVFTDKERSHWSYQPVTDAKPPEVPPDSIRRNEIDGFIIAKLEENGLSPAPQADRRTLIRRLTYDMTGLPPTMEELDSFNNDERDDAYERAADRLLASPAYGEHWARHWLDIVRYAESDGFRKDDYRPNAWHYRDYVIDAFNRDLPYDRFVAEQLAGDEIAPNDLNGRVATGFLRHGVYEYNQRDAETQQSDILNEMTDLVADVFLGLGMGCARCHDHKFDPLLQTDYYKLRSFFSGTIPDSEVPLATPDKIADYEKRHTAWLEATKEIRDEIESIEGPIREKLKNDAVDRFPPEVQAMYRKPADERTSYEEQVTELVQRQVVDAWRQLPSRIKKEQKERYDELTKQLAKNKPAPLPTMMTVYEYPGDVTVMSTPGGQEVAPGFPAILGAEQPPSDTKGDLRRAELARWLTKDDNPLVPRVIVNRLWHYHFGRGLSASTSDFGNLGTPPTHPQLLDWLARRLVEEDWQLKQLHRWIVCSSTYRQSSHHPDAKAAASIDPDDLLLWRWNRRRMGAEAIRDTVLAASGSLVPTFGGPGVDGKTPRRTIYVKKLRNTREPIAVAFDAPDMISSAPERSVTTTALQALYALNDPWMIEQATALIQRLRSAEPLSAQARVDQLYRILYGRPAQQQEIAMALQFMEQQQSLIDDDRPSWTSIASLETIANRAEPALRFANDVQDVQIGSVAPLLQNTDGFLLEAIVCLESIYSDASVRVIASEWDGDTKHVGWSVGVTSEKSRYEPRNLIVQLIGKNSAQKVQYEVIASDLHLELNRPYYLAVAVDAKGGRTDFRLQDLAKPDSEPKLASVEHPKLSEALGQHRLVLGGRIGQGRHAWHGYVEQLQLVAGVPGEESLRDPMELRSHAVGCWSFATPEPLADISPAGHPLKVISATADTTSPKDAAWIDLCHALLNGSELIYID